LEAAAEAAAGAVAALRGEEQGQSGAEHDATEQTRAESAEAASAIRLVIRRYVALPLGSGHARLLFGPATPVSLQPTPIRGTVNHRDTIDF
jgi:hypothetical protein